MRRSAWLLALSGLGCSELLGLDEYGTRTPATASSTGSGASTGSNAGGSGGGAGGVSSPGGGGGTSAVGGGGAAPTHKRVFVSSGVYGPSVIDSVDQANTICQRLGASLNGIWQAWLSDKVIAAEANVTGQGPWYTLEDELAFENRAELLSVVGQPQTPIDIDENGSPVPSLDHVWTGTVKGGTRGAMCESGSDDWVSNGSLSGTAGVVSMPVDWTASVPDSTCENIYRIYCFEL